MIDETPSLGPSSTRVEGIIKRRPLRRVREPVLVHREFRPPQGLRYYTSIFEPATIIDTM